MRRRQDVRKRLSGDVRLLMITTTGCLCFLIIVVLTMLGLLFGRIGPEHLGSLTSLGVGGGILAMLGITVQFIGYSFRRGSQDE